MTGCSRKHVSFEMQSAYLVRQRQRYKTRLQLPATATDRSTATAAEEAAGLSVSIAECPIGLCLTSVAIVVCSVAPVLSDQSDKVVAAPRRDAQGCVSIARSTRAIDFKLLGGQQRCSKPCKLSCSMLCLLCSLYSLITNFARSNIAASCAC